MMTEHMRRRACCNPRRLRTMMPPRARFPERRPVTTPETMFERYGGLPFVTRLVLSFYDRVLASSRLAPFFADTDMQRLVEHQARFISTVMGGPASCSNAVLHEAHAHLAIDDPAFDEMIA